MVSRGYLTRCLLTLLLLGAASAHAAERVFTAVYKGAISGFNVELTRTLTEVSPGRYRLESSASNLFAGVRETSDFEVGEGRWQPLEYVYERKVFGRKTVERIQYDWAKGQAFYTRSNRARDNTQHKLIPGLLDPALYQLALQVDARAGDAPKELGYVFLKRRSARHYRFVLAEPTTIEIAGNKVDAVRYRKEPEEDTRTSAWLVPEWDYVLGRLVHQDGDDVYEVHLTKYTADRALFDRFAQLSAPKK